MALIFRLWALMLLLLTYGDLSAQRSQEVEPMWYAQPAQEWEEALPIGNGRLAAMIFGGVSEERVQWNEESLWSGNPQEEGLRWMSVGKKATCNQLF